MPKPSSVSDSSPPDRAAVARDLYIGRGAQPASARCDANARFGARDLAAEIVAALAPRPGHCVVDVGCGAGAHLARLAGSVAPSGRAVGVDFSADAVSLVRARGLLGVVASGDALPIRAESADAVTCNFAVYYFRDLDAAVAEWRRVLRRGGRLLVSGPAERTNEELYAFHRAATGRPPSDADRMALGFVSREVVPRLRAAGFEAVEEEEFVNPVAFPDASAFLDYWTNTSLFARTPGADRAQGERYFAARAHAGPVAVHKRVTLARARRPA